MLDRRAHVHDSVHMTTISRGLRLHPGLWAKIAEEAYAHRMKPNEYLALRLSTLFSFDPSVHNSRTNDDAMHTEGVRFTDGD